MEYSSFTLSPPFLFFFVSDISHRNAIVSNCISLVTRCICAVRVDCWPTGLSCTKCFRPQTHVLVFKNMSWSSRTCSYLTGSGYQWRRQGGRGEASPLWVDVQKLCNMCVLSLSWNFFVSHVKYTARPSSKEPRWYTGNTTGTGGLRTLDPL